MIFRGKNKKGGNEENAVECYIAKSIIGIKVGATIYLERRIVMLSNEVVRKSIIVALGLSCLFCTGCTVVVRPIVSESEFITDDAKIPATVALCLNEEFRGYSYSHLDWVCDGRNYKMEVGPFASDWFRYAFESRIDNVIVKSAKPEFPLSESGVDLVVTPKFTSFEAGGPWIVKMEQYWVEVGMNIKIQDGQGKVLEAMELQQKGVKGGSIGLQPGSHIYPETCRIAVKSIVDQTIEKIDELSIQ